MCTQAKKISHESPRTNNREIMAVAKMAGSAELSIHLHGERRMGIVGTVMYGKSA
jgi:hypothetical protein